MLELRSAASKLTEATHAWRGNACAIHKTGLGSRPSRRKLAGITSRRKRWAGWCIWRASFPRLTERSSTGTVGAGRTIEEGYAAARACALTQLAVLKQHLGSLDAVKKIVTVNGYVNAVPGFQDSPKVINGASDLFVELFGEAGRHVRAAIGVPRCRATRSSSCK